MIGEVVANRFQIESLAGEGGMGTVYRAHDRERDATVALKIFRTHARANEQEARTLVELVHPNIVRCVAFGTTDDGHDFLATEWLEGETLRDRLARGPLPIAQTIRVARRVAEGLAAAHAWGITHRDVTPANVMLLGDASQVKVLDFGLAVRGREGGSAGTVGYAAPEQARGEALSPRADVFSLGCVMCECLLGEKAFAADTDVAVMARMLEGDTARVTSRLTGVPSALVKLVARMLSSDPEGRPRDASVVASELAALEDQSASAFPSTRSVTDAEARASQVLVAETAEALPRSSIARLTAELEALGAKLAWRGARVSCVWQTETSAVERAVRGARAALAVRRADAHARASLVSATSVASASRAAEESLPQSPSIRVDTDTARLLGDRFVVRPDASEAFGDLVLLREAASPHSRTSLLGHETTCVGRDREIGLVVSTFEECRDEPDARVVWVTGAPGIGKTRVRDEVIARVVRGDPPPRVWSAQADPTRAGVALGILGELVRSAASIAAGDAELHQRAWLEARACAHVSNADKPRVIEFLSELLRIPAESPSDQLRAAREEPLLMGDQIRRAFEDLALAELARGPLAIVVEDLQWADAPSVRALADLARVARDKPFFLLLLGRPEAKDTLLKLVADRQPTGVALGKLGAKAMEKLVVSAFGGPSAQPSAALVADIAQRSGGNPFFAEELVRAAATGVEPMAALAMLESRLMALEPEARRVLRAGSVFGPQFVSGDVAVLLGESDRNGVEFVDAWCAWLAEREVLSQSGGMWSFRHALVRDAAYAMLTDADRKAAHLLAAEHLERDPRGLGPVIADHFARAGEPDRASRWLAASAAEALEANDLTACVDLAERAIAAPTTASDRAEWRGELLVVLAEARRWRGEYERCAACAREAIRLLPEGSARFFRAAAELVAATGTVGPPEEFEAAIARLDVAPHAKNDEASATVARSIACSRAAMHLITRGDPRGDALLARAAASADSDLARGRAEQAYGFRASIRGELEEVVRRYAASTRAFEAAGDLRTACVQELNAAAALCELGRDDEARAHLERGAREADARNLSSAVALAHHLAGILRAREGRIDEAVIEQRTALETFAAQGNARMAGGVRCHLAELFLKQKKLDDALAEATRACDALANIAPARARALAALALVHVARGDAPAALDASARALELAETAGVESGEAIVYAARVDALGLAKADASAVREAGRAKLRARAASIADATLRESFLRVPENARLLASP